MKKEVLEKAKEKIIAMAVADVEKGKYSVEILQIIMSGICDIQKKEYQEEQEKHKAEKEKDNKEYAELLALNDTNKLTKTTTTTTKEVLARE